MHAKLFFSIEAKTKKDDDFRNVFKTVMPACI